VTDPLPERSARVPTRRGPGERRTWNVEGAASTVPGSKPRKHAPRRNALATFSAVFLIGARLRKIAVGIFKHFILIAVAQLTMEIRVPVGGGRTGFFFHRSLVEIAVRVLLFWHRALRDEGFACDVARKELGGRIISGLQSHFGYRAAVTAFTSV
jgi:hypothetical protein